MTDSLRSGNRIKTRLMVAITLAACAAALGCPSTPPPKGTTQGAQPAAGAGTNGDSVPGNGKPVATTDGPPLADWKTPAAAFLLTGEQHGYFEPCGCTLHQLGGMARRGDLARILSQERKWPLSGLDIGGMLKRNRKQDQIKFVLMMEALKSMKYAGAALGHEELKLGADFLLQHRPTDPEELKNSVALLGANVVLFGQAELSPLPFRIIEVGEVKVGVTAVVGASIREHVAPAGVVSDITIQDPAEVLPGVIEKMTAEKPAFLILLSHGTEAEAKELAEKFPQFQIILTAGGPEEPESKPVVVGKTWILEAGQKGKRVGVLGYYPDNSEQPFRYDLVALDDARFKDDPYMRTLMKNYQQQVQDEALDTSDELLLRHPSGNTFVGARKCGECHKKAYEHWKDTKHAEGLASLKTGHPGQEETWVVRIHDPECLSCHVTGWEPQQMLRFDSGYISEEKTPHLVGQQCENCHGPGSKHTALEEALVAKAADLNMDDVTASRKDIKRVLEQARKDLCIQCHDSDNSPKFTPDAFKDYWDQVAHPWKD